MTSAKRLEQMAAIEALPWPFEDEDLVTVIEWFQAQDGLEWELGNAIRSALDAVIDTPNTGRWDLEDCDDVEKTYLGFKVEHLLRGIWQLKRGTHGMDYSIAGVDVDCKWSKNWGSWQIPLEAVGHICLVVWADDNSGHFAAGLVRIHEAMLVGGNQDKKRTLQSPAARSRVHWVVDSDANLPENFLLKLDDDDRSAILKQTGGDRRAIELFKRCHGRIIQRHTLESVGMQSDSMRRFRGESRARLKAQGYEILNGHWKADRERALQLGGPVPIGSQQWVSLKVDGTSWLVTDWA